ncbi:hypothetical protein PHMEG_00027487 [Phytophthora megakarya]|uniref:Uncharacterized protein n=1 Tax=Phytophthora megakarya TaxID=4795 RepID=A0A225V7A0_9STRA|nr:hypothetical protein PHMEG_00027487 [Phytophthora megakarya]
MFADMMTSQTTGAPHPADARPVGEGHKLEMNEEWVEVNGIRKRRRWQCKVFTIYKTERLQAVSAIKLDIRPAIYNLMLDMHAVRQYHYPNYNLTCYEIWHQLWRNGSERPQARCGRDIQTRGPRKKHGGIDEVFYAEEG